MCERIDANAIKDTSIFKGLTEKDVQLATDDIELVDLTAGDILFHQGDAGAEMFFVISGQLEVRLSVPGAEDRVVSVVGPNSIIGEMSLLLDEPRAATVSAVGDCALWKLSRTKFENALEWNERWANKFLYYAAQILARRLGSMNREIVDMAAKCSAPSTDANSPADLEQMFQNMFANL